MPVNWVALSVFIIVFLGVAALGFAAANWRRGDLNLLHEWGLGGGTFGTLITWFLIGGDIYTAYTFIAVPALAFGAGAIAFFAVPYTTLIYPMTFVIFPRLWSVCRRHGYITAADFVRGRFGNRWLALAALVSAVAVLLGGGSSLLRAIDAVREHAAGGFVIGELLRTATAPVAAIGWVLAARALDRPEIDWRRLRFAGTVIATTLGVAFAARGPELVVVLVDPAGTAYRVSLGLSAAADLGLALAVASAVSHSAPAATPSGAAASVAPPTSPLPPTRSGPPPPSPSSPTTGPTRCRAASPPGSRSRRWGAPSSPSRSRSRAASWPPAVATAKRCSPSPPPSASPG